MPFTPVIEKHYIAIGVNSYQIIFDAQEYTHDILIRGLFHWDAVDTSKINKIDFLLDNLSTVKVTHTIIKAEWCSNQNRIELHINNNSGTVLRTSESLAIPNGVDLKTVKQIELVLRIYEVSETVNSCEVFELGENHDKQKDKDGSILIGSIVTLP
ncbi:hypothetical protein [Aequorivita viscosa]|uniref:Uncharacterized protein n=1 Tax=Aequorivita viscosa TaxID=797419 RepID=A0A1M6EIB7_9FLAO|nr:hypothetical protein [Aequorivita viscosa]SDW02363.1 hypothetical protein SAMN05216556_101146 [Aequorivita viscosa]SHI85247.1 hypothetical protein SAMN04487908_10675 [Aequorivita viscosa]